MMYEYDYDENYYNPTDGWSTEERADFEDKRVDTLSDLLNEGFSLIDFSDLEVF